MPEAPWASYIRERANDDAQLSVQRGLDGNKEEAAHSIDIAQKTGSDPEYIYSHYPAATRAYRSNLTQDAVTDDYRVQAYFNSHPLASIVSKDDVSNLSTYSQAYNKLKDFVETRQPLSITRGLIKGAEYGFGTDPIGSWQDSLWPGLYSKPPFGKAAWAAWAALGSPVEAMLRTGSAAVYGAAGLTEEYYKAVGGSPAFAAKLARDIIPPIQMLLSGALGPEFAALGIMRAPVKAPAIAPPIEPIPAGRIVATNKFVERFLKNEEVPPLGVNPIVDRVMAEETKLADKAYDETIKAAHGSETRELSPEMWNNFVNSKEPVGLKWEAARRLYGDKLPQPGDGLLGDVPGITEKWNRSSFSAEDIQVPWDAWTKIERGVEQQLKDDKRLRPDMMTPNEAKNVPEPKAAPWRDVPPLEDNQQLINDMRQSMGIESLDGLFEPPAIEPKRTQERMLKAINEINEDDVKKQFEIEQAKAARRLKPEWDREAAEHYTEALSDVENRPDFAAWRFFTDGEFKGNKFDARPKIDPAFLSEEQRKQFPEHWTSPTGFNPDQLASDLGFRTGDEMINSMIDFRNMKGEAPYRQFRANVVRAEAQRRMELKYGDFDNLTAQEAREHVVAPRAEDLVWNEYQELADRLGMELPYTRETVKAMAHEAFESSLYQEQSVIKYTRELARTAKETNEAWSKGDVQGAFIGRQKSVHQLAMALEAKKFEQRLRSDTRILKSLREVSPTGMDPEYADWAHSIMLDHEIPTRRDPDHLAETIARPERKYKTLEQFVNAHNVPIDPENPAAVGLPIGHQDYLTIYNPSLPVWDRLLDPTFKDPVDTMSVRQYKALTNSLRVLKKVGQDKGGDIITIEGKEYNRSELKQQLIATLETFSEAKSPVREGDMKIRMWARRMDVGLKTMETFVNRLDRFDESGVWTNRVFNPGVNAEHLWGQLNAELVPLLREALKTEGGPRWMQKQILNDTLYHPAYIFKDANGDPIFPLNNKHVLPMNNERLIGLILNYMDDPEHTAAGFSLTDEQLQGYLSRVATPEHYRIAENYAKLYEHVQKLEDDMTMTRTGTVLEKPVHGKRWTPFGEKDGRYFPRRRDMLLSDGLPGITEHPTPIRALTEHGWTEQRTGEIYPVKLDLNDIPDDLIRRTRHTAISPYLDVYNQILTDREVRNAIQRHWGSDYNDMFRNFFNDLAGQHGTPERYSQVFSNLFGWLNRNAITDAVGFNLGTIEKHFPQALIQSFNEIGWLNALRAVRNLYKTNSITGQRNINFMMEGGRVGDRDWRGSGELQRRARYWRDDLNVASDEALGRQTWEQWASGHAGRAGTYMLAKTDSIVSKIVWQARYDAEMDAAMSKINERGLTPSEFNDAIWDAHNTANDRANKAVRLTHGSTAITSKPQLLRSQNPVLRFASSVMNFFNNVLNRRFRMLGMTKDMILGTSPRSMWTDLRTIGTDFVTYMVMPTLIENFVDPLCKEDDDAATCTLKFVGQGMAAPIPFARDIVHGWITGHDPSVGLIYNGVVAAKRLYQEGSKPLRDDDINYGNFVQNALSLVGTVRGIPLTKPAAWMNYILKLSQGEEEPPRTVDEWNRVIRFGRTEQTRHEEERRRLPPAFFGE